MPSGRIDAKFVTSQGERVIKNVTVTNVREDGTFSLKWTDGIMLDCSPELVRLYDENGIEVQPAIDPQPPQITPEMYEALIILLGGGSGG